MALVIVTNLEFNEKNVASINNFLVDLSVLYRGVSITKKDNKIAIIIDDSNRLLMLDKLESFVAELADKLKISNPTARVESYAMQNFLSLPHIAYSDPYPRTTYVTIRYIGSLSHSQVSELITPLLCSNIQLLKNHMAIVAQQSMPGIITIEIENLELSNTAMCHSLLKEIVTLLAQVTEIKGTVTEIICKMRPLSVFSSYVPYQGPQAPIRTCAGIVVAANTTPAFFIPGQQMINGAQAQPVFPMDSQNIRKDPAPVIAAYNNVAFEKLLVEIAASTGELDLSKHKLIDVIRTREEFEKFCQAILAKKTQLTSLNLSDNNLHTWNLSLTQTSKTHPLISLLQTIRQLKSLKVLRLGNNKLAKHAGSEATVQTLSEIFSTIGEMEQLEELDLSNNGLFSIYDTLPLISNSTPKEKQKTYERSVHEKHVFHPLKKLRNLRSLNLSGSYEDIESNYCSAEDVLNYPPLLQLISALKKLEIFSFNNNRMYRVYKEYLDSLFTELSNKPLIKFEMAHDYKTVKNRSLLTTHDGNEKIYWLRILNFAKKLLSLQELDISGNCIADLHDDSLCIQILNELINIYLNTAFSVTFHAQECESFSNQILYGINEIIKKLNQFAKKDKSIEEQWKSMKYPAFNRQARPIFYPIVPKYEKDIDLFAQSLVKFVFDLNLNLLFFLAITKTNLKPCLDNCLLLMSICEQLNYPALREQCIYSFKDKLIVLAGHAESISAAVVICSNLPETNTLRIGISFDVMQASLANLSLDHSEQFLTVLPACLKVDGTLLDFDGDQLKVFDAYLLRSVGKSLPITDSTGFQPLTSEQRKKAMEHLKSHCEILAAIRDVVVPVQDRHKLFVESILKFNYGQALRLACGSDDMNQFEIVKILLKYKDIIGLDVNEPDSVDELTAIHHAAKKGNQSLYDLLLINNANPHSLDKSQNTAEYYLNLHKQQTLHVGSIKTNSPITITGNTHEILLKRIQPICDKYQEDFKPFLESVINKNYSQALRRACTCTVPEGKQLIQILFEYKEVLTIKINEKNKDGDAPIHLAAGRGNQSLYDLLVSYGADVTEAGSKGLKPEELLANNKKSSIQPQK